MILVSRLSTILAILSMFFFFNDTATTEIYTLSLHDALPISTWLRASATKRYSPRAKSSRARRITASRSEEHTSELQSPCNLVCRLLLEKKKKDCVRATPLPSVHTTDCNYDTDALGTRHPATS